MPHSISYRMATEGDAESILALIRELAAYEHAEDAVEATPELLRDQMFSRGAAEALLACDGDDVVGMALFFPCFSTWTGTANMYLEDLCVSKSHRGQGIGSELMARLARICVDRGWKRFDWECLDWNEPSLGFYCSIGAQPLDEWVRHRLDGAALRALAARAGAGEDATGKEPAE